MIIDCENHVGYYQESRVWMLHSLQHPDYPTTCSLMFDPQKNEVYIAWKGNFSKISKVSVEKGVIDAYEGYNHRKMLSIPAGEEGLPVSDVADYFDTP